jgi:hypothetical protein
VRRSERGKVLLLPYVGIFACHFYDYEGLKESHDLDWVSYYRAWLFLLSGIVMYDQAASVVVLWLGTLAPGRGNVVRTVCTLDDAER